MSRFKDKNLKARYGITLDVYEHHRVIQQGRCAICGSLQGRRLVVDHDHNSGHLRGLLCSNCNRGIGLLRDSPEVCARAAIYLAREEGRLSE